MLLSAMFVLKCETCICVEWTRDNGLIKQ